MQHPRNTVMMIAAANVSWRAVLVLLSPLRCKLNRGSWSLACLMLVMIFLMLSWRFDSVRFSECRWSARVLMCMSPNVVWRFVSPSSIILFRVLIWVVCDIVCWFELVCIIVDVVMEQFVPNCMKLIPVCMEVVSLGVCGHLISALSGRAVNIVATLGLIIIRWCRLVVTSILGLQRLVVSLLKLCRAIDFSQLLP